MRGVSMAAKRDALHRLRTFTGTRSLDCSLDRIERDHRIRSVDAHGGDRPASLNPLSEIRVHHLRGARRRVRVTVRLQDEDRGNLPDTGEVEAFVHIADGERSLAEERQRHVRLAAPLERERGTDDDGAEVAEHRHEREDTARGHTEVHVPVAAERRAVAAAEEVAERVRHRDAAGEVRGELAVERRDDVAVFQREPGGGCDRLLSEAVVHRPADPPLPVERPRSLLERPLQEHQPEELETRVSSQGDPRSRR